MPKHIALVVFLITASFWKLAYSHSYTFLEAPDIANHVLPVLQLQATAIRQGVIALWDPYLFGGQPLVGQMQPGITSPFTYLLLAMPLKDGRLDPAMVHYWFVLMHCIAGVFAYLLFCEMALPQAACVIAAYFFAIGGYNGNTTWPQYFAGAIWLPLVTLYLIRALRGASPLPNAAAAGLFLGVSWLCGHHQVPYFASLTVALVLAGVAIRRRTTGLLIPAAALFAVAGLVCAVQLLPAFEYGQLSVRWLGPGDPVDWKHKVPYDVHRTHSLAIGDLVYLVLPGAEDAISNPFAGAVALTLAAFATARSARPFWWLAAGTLAFAVARHNPVHRLLYELVPGFDKARSPATLVSLTNLALSVLVAYGIAALVRRQTPVRWWWCLAAAAALAGVAMLLVPGLPSRWWTSVAVTLAVSLLLRFQSALPRNGFLALIAVLLFAEHNATVGYNYREFSDRATVAVLPRLTGETDQPAAFLRAGAPHRSELRYDDVLFNFGDWHAIETLSGYLPSVLAVTHRLGWWDPRVLAMYGVRYSAAAAPFRDGQRRVFSGVPGGLNVYENPWQPMPRAWAVHRLRRVGDAATEVRGGSFDFAQEAVMESDPPPMPSCGDGRSIVTVTARTLHSLTLDADMPCRGLVIAAENVFPGWEAFVDGQPAPILAANAALRSVVVDKGRHRIEMRYRPRSVYFGLALTLIGLCLGIAAIYHGRPAP